VKIAPDEKVLSVPVSASLLKAVKAEAKLNGLQLRESIVDALELWLRTTTYRREVEEVRLHERRERKQS